MTNCFKWVAWRCIGFVLLAWFFGGLMNFLGTGVGMVTASLSILTFFTCFLVDCLLEKDENERQRGKELVNVMSSFLVTSIVVGGPLVVGVAMLFRGLA